MTNDTCACPRCGIAKPTSEFGKDRSRTSGLKRECKECNRERAKQYYEKVGRERRGHRKRAATPHVINQCIQCGNKFQERWEGHKYCSVECSSISRRIDPSTTTKETRGGWQVEIRKCEWCAELFVNNRDAQLTCSTECAEKRRHSRDINKAHRRREHIKAVTVEPVKVMQVYERDNWMCGLCGEPIDQELKWPHPKSVSLDHIVPISKGGAHSMGNTQASHLGCNIAKGNRPDLAVS